MRDRWTVWAGVFWFSVAACGPDRRPPEGCDGPNFDLVVSADDEPLPPDTRINVRYGSNQEGEPYALGQPGRKQAVFCEEDLIRGGAPSEELTTTPSGGLDGGAGGATSAPSADPNDEGQDVWALRCRLFTQGPARVDVTATGYAPVKDRGLPYGGEHRCDVEVEVVLTPLPSEMED